MSKSPNVAARLAANHPKLQAAYRQLVPPTSATWWSMRQTLPKLAFCVQSSSIRSVADYRLPPADYGLTEYLQFLRFCLRPTGETLDWETVQRY